MGNIRKKLLGSIQKRLLIYIVSTAILSFAVVGIYDYTLLRDTIITNEEQKLSLMAESTAQKIGNYMTTRGELAFVLAQDETVYKFAKQAHYRDEDLSNDKDYNNMKITYRRLAQRYQDVGHFYVGIPQHDRLYSNITVHNYPPDYNMEKRPWFTEAIKQNKIIYSLPYLDFTGERYITAAMPFYDEAGDLLGVAGVDILESSLTEQIRNIKFLEQGYAFLIDTNGTFISHPNQDYYLKSFQDITELKDNPELYNKMTANHSGLEINSVNGEKRYVSYQKIAGMDWILGIVVPIAAVQAPLDMAGQTSIIILILVVSMLVYLISLLIRKTTDPINDITEVMQKVAAGDYTVKMEINSEDEFGTLSQSINSTLAKQQETLKRTIDISYEIGVAGNELEILISGAKSAIMILDEHFTEKSDNPVVQEDALALIPVLDNMQNKISLMKLSVDSAMKALENHNWPEAYNYIKGNYLLLNEMEISFIKNSPALRKIIDNIEESESTLNLMKQQLNNIANILQSDYLDKARQTSGTLLALSQDLLEITSKYKINR